MKSFAALLPVVLSLLGASAQTLPLTPAVDGLRTVHATVDGHEGTFLFDSGSGISSISPPPSGAIPGARSPASA